MSRKLALVIGNTDYIDPGLVQLTAPRNDAQDFARVLREQNLCGFDEVRMLLNEPSSTVTEAIDEFFDQRKPDDLLVLYFSGHGVRDEFGSLYLAVKNTIRTRLRATGIKSDYIREAMDQSRSKRQVVVLDCCNSGAFPQGTKAELGGPMGLGSALQGYGRYVLMASDTTQFAWEGDRVIGEAKDSLFTHFLVKGLEGEADQDADGRISVDELYDYAYEEIARLTTKQTPTKAASKVEGEFVLRQITRLEDIKPVPLPDDLLDEAKDPRPYVRQAAVEKLEVILKGRNLGLRRSAVEALERIAADDNTTPRVSREARQSLESYRGEQEAAQTPGTLAPTAAVAEQAQKPSEAQQARLPAEPAKQQLERETPRSKTKPAQALYGETLLAEGVPPARVVQVAEQKPAEAARSVAAPRPQVRGGKKLWIAIGAIAGVIVLAYIGARFLARPVPAATPPPDHATEAAATDMAIAAPANTAASVAAVEASPTTVAVATQTAPITIEPQIGNKDESVAAWNSDVPTLRDKSVDKYTAADYAAPTTLTFQVPLRESEQVRWEWFWCSKSQSILDDNLTNIDLHFVMDGQDVTSQFISMDFENIDSANRGWQCRMYFVVLSKWQAGTYHLRTTAAILRNINDGSSDYVAGDYINDYSITVR